MILGFQADRIPDGAIILLLLAFLSVLFLVSLFSLRVLYKIAKWAEGKID